MKKVEPPQKTVLYDVAFRLSPMVRDVFLENRQRAHIHVMSGFRSGLGENPRSKLDLLWHIDHSASVLHVRANEASRTSRPNR